MSRVVPLVLCALALSATSCAAQPRKTSTSTLSSARIEVAQVEGAAPEHVREVFARAVEPVKRCVPGHGRLLTFRARTEDGVVRLDLDSAPLLDPTEKACVMGALSNVIVADTAAQAGAPQIPPSGFTSLVTVAW